MDWFRETGEGMVLQVRVVPRSSRNAVDGVLGTALKIRLQAPPVDGKANAQLVEFLADELDLPRRQVRLVGGETGRDKRVLITGISADELRRAWNV